MNLGIITSYVVGGLLLISLMVLNNSVLQNSGETTLDISTKTTIATISDVLSHDFQRIGYDSTGAVSSPVNSYSSTRISFMADVVDSDGLGAQTVTWEFKKTSKPVTSTENPNDYYLVRSGPLGKGISGETSYPVTDFQLSYYTINDSVATNSSDINRIDVKIISESGEKVTFSNSSEGYYPRSIWERSFSPPNIQVLK